ncbi:MAG: glycosyltransferase family 2 protein [Rhodocyclaceae bacterium]|nr:MAG: glycosyltransferase family 2 protein [Rhodocyclaceae bacterium]
MNLDIHEMPILSIIVPAYNEERTIQQVIERIQTSKLPENFTREIIIINDGSTDLTRTIVDSYAERHTVIHSINTGKGGAVRKGFHLSKGDYIVVQDADLEQNPDDFVDLIKPIADGQADVVFGSRFLGSYRPISLLMNLHYLTNKAFTVIANVITGYRTTDVWTGYKMYSRRALDAILPALTADGIEFELEVTVLLSKKGMRVADVPISYVPRWYAEGKKTNWRQALVSLRKLFEYSRRKV